MYTSSFEAELPIEVQCLQGGGEAVYSFVSRKHVLISSNYFY